MKTVRSFFAVILLLLLTRITFAQTIVGSEHDFSGESWNTSGEICAVCHAPHNADVTVTNAPLWNHQTTIASFNTYTSATMHSTTGQPDASSKLCLSCHDGTVAVDNFGGQTAGSYYLSGSSLIDTELNDDHPISFTYDVALANSDGGLHDPTTTNSGLGGTIDDDMLMIS